MYVRPFPNVSGGLWQISQDGGNFPHWSHSGRELFNINGDRAVVAAAVVPGSPFSLGAQKVLFDASPLRRVGEYTLFFDVAPDDQRFLMERPLLESGRPGATKTDQLVQITNWAAEVHAKLTGKGPR